MSLMYLIDSHFTQLCIICICYALLSGSCPPFHCNLTYIICDRCIMMSVDSNWLTPLRRFNSRESDVDPSAHAITVFDSRPH